MALRQGRWRGPHRRREGAVGFEAAIRDAIAKASETVRNIEGAWVKEQKVMVSDGKVTGFRVHLEVTFVLD